VEIGDRREVVGTAIPHLTAHDTRQSKVVISAIENDLPSSERG
jgi:hypothetical protein